MSRDNIPRDEWKKRRITPRLSRIYSWLERRSMADVPEKGGVVERGVGAQLRRYKIHSRDGYWQRIA